MNCCLLSVVVILALLSLLLPWKTSKRILLFWFWHVQCWCALYWLRRIYKSKYDSLSYVIHPFVAGVLLVLQVRLTSACVILICTVVWISVIFQGNLCLFCHSNSVDFSVYEALYCIIHCEVRNHSISSYFVYKTKTGWRAESFRINVLVKCSNKAPFVKGLFCKL